MDLVRPLFLLACCSVLPAQTAQTGIHFFAVENRTTARVEQRGTAGAAGVAFSNLILAPSTKYRAPRVDREVA